MNDPHRLPETWATACGENKQNFQGFNRIQTCASQILVGGLQSHTCRTGRILEGSAFL